MDHNPFQTERKPPAHAGSDKVYLVLEGRCVFTVDGEPSSRYR